MEETKELVVGGRNSIGSGKHKDEKVMDKSGNEKIKSGDHAEAKSEEDEKEENCQGGNVHQMMARIAEETKREDEQAAKEHHLEEETKKRESSTAAKKTDDEVRSHVNSEGTEGKDSKREEDKSSGQGRYIQNAQRLNEKGETERKADMKQNISEEKQKDETTRHVKDEHIQDKDFKHEVVNEQGGIIQNDQPSNKTGETAKQRNSNSVEEKQKEDMPNHGKTEGTQDKNVKHEEDVNTGQGTKVQTSKEQGEIEKERKRSFDEHAKFNVDKSNEKDETKKHVDFKNGEQMQNDKIMCHRETEGTHPHEKDAKQEKVKKSGQGGEDLHKVIDETVEKTIKADEDLHKKHHPRGGMFSGITTCLAEITGKKHHDDVEDRNE